MGQQYEGWQIEGDVAASQRHVELRADEPTDSDGPHELALADAELLDEQLQPLDAPWVARGMGSAAELSGREARVLPDRPQRRAPELDRARHSRAPGTRLPTPPRRSVPPPLPTQVRPRPSFVTPLPPPNVAATPRKKPLIVPAPPGRSPRDARHEEFAVDLEPFHLPAPPAGPAFNEVFPDVSSMSSAFSTALPSARSQANRAALRLRRGQPFLMPLLALTVGVAAIAVGTYYWVQPPHSVELATKTVAPVTQSEAPQREARVLPQVEQPPAAAVPAFDPPQDTPDEAAPYRTAREHRRHHGDARRHRGGRAHDGRAHDASQHQPRRIAHQLRRAARHKGHRHARERASHVASEPASRRDRSLGNSIPAKKRRAEPTSADDDELEALLKKSLGR